MSTPLAMSAVQSRPRLAAVNPTLGNVLIAALVGNVVVNTVLQALFLDTLIVGLATIMALTLVVAAVCATRLAPLLAAVRCVVLPEASQVESRMSSKRFTPSPHQRNAESS